MTVGVLALPPDWLGARARAAGSQVARTLGEVVDAVIRRKQLSLEDRWHVRFRGTK
jgi:hypothetical protein